MSVTLLVLLVSGVVGWRWGTAIAAMHDRYPDYRGEDFLDWPDGGR